MHQWGPRLSTFHPPLAQVSEDQGEKRIKEDRLRRGGHADPPYSFRHAFPEVWGGLADPPHPPPSDSSHTAPPDASGVINRRGARKGRPPPAPSETLLRDGAVPAEPRARTQQPSRPPPPPPRSPPPPGLSPLTVPAGGAGPGRAGPGRAPPPGARTAAALPAARGRRHDREASPPRPLPAKSFPFNRRLHGGHCACAPSATPPLPPPGGGREDACAEAVAPPPLPRRRVGQGRPR